MLIDTHCHLNFPDYKNDLDSVIKNSVSAGVEKIICVSSSMADSKRSIEIAGKYTNIVYPAIGIHPQQTDPENHDSVDEQIDQLHDLSKHFKIYAIGEIGLDFSLAPPPEKDRDRGSQIYLFEKQMELAKSLDIPIIIHSRKSNDEIIPLLEKHHPKGIWHCYTGGIKRISKVVDLGLYFGIDGNLTYDEGLQNVVKEIPLEKIVLETDSPFLSPLPNRGQRNTPENIKIICETLAKIKDISFDQTAKITTENAKNIFKI
jgi:TatD DNase family protein